MKRWFPQVRAQCERARQPVIMFLIGMALATPAGTYLVRKDGATALTAATVRTTQAALAAAIATPVDSRDAMTKSLAQMFGVPMDLAGQIHDAAEDAGITPRLAFGLVRTESRFKSTAVSHVGAVGLTQVMPSTARWFRKGTTRRDLFDPETNLSIGFKYLHELMDKYDGDVRLALTAYNRGPGTVDRAVRRGRNPENGYADMVLRDPGTLREHIIFAKADLTPVRNSAALSAKEAKARDAFVDRANRLVKKTADRKVTRHTTTRSKKKFTALKHTASKKKAAARKLSLPKPPELHFSDPV